MKKSIPLYFPPINKLGNIAFRKTCLIGGADFVFSEMIRIERLLEDDINTIKKLDTLFEDKEKTFIQIISSDIELIEKGVEKIVSYFPQIKEINYNMGCPQSSLVKNECGGGIVANPVLVEKVAIKLKSACDKFGIVPSIKIRIGITRDKITIYENVNRIRNSGIKKIYIHGRVLKDSYQRPATYEEISRVKKENPDLEIIANGDIIDIKSFEKVINSTNCDGVLIGRAALENPFIFNEIKNSISFDINKSGDDIKDRKKRILTYIKLVKDLDVSISQIKSNLTYMTNKVVGGSEFRKNLNPINEKEKIIDYITNYF